MTAERIAELRKLANEAKTQPTAMWIHGRMPPRTMVVNVFAEVLDEIERLASELTEARTDLADWFKSEIDGIKAQIAEQRKLGLRDALAIIEEMYEESGDHIYGGRKMRDALRESVK